MMNLSELEIAARDAWPALEEQEQPFGVLRYSNGVNRRSNSLNVYADVDYQLGKLVDITEQFFRQRRQPAIVRILCPDHAVQNKFHHLDNYLSACGYAIEALTQVMSLDLWQSEFTVPTGGNVGIVCDRCTWLQARQGLIGFNDEQRNIHQKILGKIACPSRCLVIEDATGFPVSCGMAVLSGAALGIYGLATKEHHRGRGYASALVQSLLQWGISQGARYAYLQVESSNTVAWRLYNDLGFSDRYSYWYRVKQLH